jgi:hypothetical protein
MMGLDISKPRHPQAFDGLANVGCLDPAEDREEMTAKGVERQNSF